jgi:GTP-binding protein
VLIVGSSNSGKSTLINELNDGIEVAKTSKRSGKTQSLNFYLCQKSEGKRRKHKDAELNVKRGMIIDSPGYGYTYAPRKVRDQWSRMMVSYLSYAIRLNLVIMLVNADLGLKACDIDMLTKLQHFNKRVQIVFTKIDKITAGSLQHNLELTSKRLQIYRNVYPEIYMLASVHGYGVKELRARIVTHF